MRLLAYQELDMTTVNDKPKKMTKKEYRAALDAMPHDERIRLISSGNLRMRKIGHSVFLLEDASRWLGLLMDANHTGSEVGRDDLSRRHKISFTKFKML